MSDSEDSDYDCEVPKLDSSTLDTSESWANNATARRKALETYVKDLKLLGHFRQASEIDTIIKRINDGVEAAIDAFEIAETTRDSQVKDKACETVKKEVRRLRKIRDSLTPYIATPAFKEKGLLRENRRLVERQMSRWKYLEKSHKIKGYSDKSLAGYMKPENHPVKKERDELKIWLVNGIAKIKLQTELTEAEIGSVLEKKGRKNEKESELSDLKTIINRHEFHLGKLETLLRVLHNTTVESDEIIGFLSQVSKIKDDVEYYLDGHRDPDYDENEFMYDDVDCLNEPPPISPVVAPVAVVEMETDEADFEPKETESELLTITKSDVVDFTTLPPVDIKLAPPLQTAELSWAAQVEDEIYDGLLNESVGMDQQQLNNTKKSKGKPLLKKILHKKMDSCNYQSRNEFSNKFNHDTEYYKDMVVRNDPNWQNNPFYLPHESARKLNRGQIGTTRGGRSALFSKKSCQGGNDNFECREEYETQMPSNRGDHQNPRTINRRGPGRGGRNQPIRQDVQKSDPSKKRLLEVGDSAKVLDFSDACHENKYNFLGSEKESSSGSESEEENYLTAEESLTQREDEVEVEVSNEPEREHIEDSIEKDWRSQCPQRSSETSVLSCVGKGYHVGTGPDGHSWRADMPKSDENIRNMNSPRNSNQVQSNRVGRNRWRRGPKVNRPQRKPPANDPEEDDGEGVWNLVQRGPASKAHPPCERTHPTPTPVLTPKETPTPVGVTTPLSTTTPECTTPLSITPTVFTTPLSSSTPEFTTPLSITTSVFTTPVSITTLVKVTTAVSTKTAVFTTPVLITTNSPVTSSREISKTVASPVSNTSKDIQRTDSPHLQLETPVGNDVVKKLDPKDYPSATPPLNDQPPPVRTMFPSVDSVADLQNGPVEFTPPPTADEQPFVEPSTMPSSAQGFVKKSIPEAVGPFIMLGLYAHGYVAPPRVYRAPTQEPEPSPLPKRARNEFPDHYLFNRGSVVDPSLPFQRLTPVPVPGEPTELDKLFEAIYRGPLHEIPEPIPFKHPYPRMNSQEPAKTEEEILLPELSKSGVETWKEEIPKDCPKKADSDLDSDLETARPKPKYKKNRKVPKFENAPGNKGIPFKGEVPLGPATTQSEPTVEFEPVPVEPTPTSSELSIPSELRMIPSELHETPSTSYKLNASALVFVPKSAYTNPITQWGCPSTVDPFPQQTTKHDIDVQSIDNQPNDAEIAEAKRREIVKAEFRAKISLITGVNVMDTMNVEPKPIITVQAETESKVTLQAEEKSKVILKPERKPMTAFQSEAKSKVVLKREPKPMVPLQTETKSKVPLQSEVKSMVILRRKPKPKISLQTEAKSNFPLQSEVKSMVILRRKPKPMTTMKSEAKSNVPLQAEAKPMVILRREPKPMAALETEAKSNVPLQAEPKPIATLKQSKPKDSLQTEAKSKVTLQSEAKQKVAKQVESTPKASETNESNSNVFTKTMQSRRRWRPKRTASSASGSEEFY